MFLQHYIWTNLFKSVGLHIPQDIHIQFGIRLLLMKRGMKLLPEQLQTARGVVFLLVYSVLVYQILLLDPLKYMLSRIIVVEQK